MASINLGVKLHLLVLDFGQADTRDKGDGNQGLAADTRKMAGGYEASVAA
jgi:hypothetical protein